MFYDIEINVMTLVRFTVISLNNKMIVSKRCGECGLKILTG